MGEVDWIIEWNLRFVGVCLAEGRPLSKIVRLFQLPTLARVVTSGDDADLRRFSINRVVVRAFAVDASGKADGNLLSPLQMPQLAGQA